MQACNFHITTVIVVASYSVTRFSDGANGFLAACAQRSVYGIAITIGWADGWDCMGGNVDERTSFIGCVFTARVHAVNSATIGLLV